jgi:CheY-like chemotaxis protein
MDKPFALIVEDDRDIAALFRHVLDIAGYHTEIVMNGREAVNRLKTVRPDIMLLDLNLPGVPGAKILEGMRADERLKNVSVVVVTAHSRAADNLEVEPDLVLLKPVSLSQLSNLVQRLRNTPLSMPEAPWDPVTHLYNRGFFSIRLSYSLERVKQLGPNRFGLVFAELGPFASLQNGFEPEQLDVFLREIAGHLKTMLRPTDTVARAEAGLFLILIDDVPDDLAAPGISDRIQRDLADFMRQKNLPEGVRMSVGMLVCGAEYGSVDEILSDLEIARRLTRGGQQLGQYDRDMLRTLRGVTSGGEVI